MGRKTLKISFVGILLISFIMAGIASAAEIKRYVFGSGPMGGPWRVGVGTGVQTLNEQLKDKYFFTAAASGGSVENVRRLINGEYHTIWAHVNNMYDALHGVGLFEGQKPYKDLRVLEYMTDQALCIVTLAKSPIKNLMDLSGKKVTIGAAGSGGVPIAKAIFQVLGLNVKVVNIGFSAGAQALKDGQLDAIINPGGPYVTPAVAEIAYSVNLRTIEPTAAEAKKIEDALSYLFLGNIPPNKAVGEGADKGKKALFWSMYWLALPSMPDEVVYDMLKVTQDPVNKELLGKVLNYWLAAGPKFDTLVKMGIPLHPGAVKFWKEKGVRIPEQIILK